MSIRAIRGATQLSANTPEAIAAGVKELILAILDANSLTPNDVVSVFFTSVSYTHLTLPTIYSV